mgnify:CR=1 FL=1
MRRIRILYKARLFTFKGIFFLLQSLSLHGVNLLALLRFAAKIYPHQKALQDERESVSYQTLYIQILKTAYMLKKQHNIHSGQKAGIICSNHLSLVRALFALSGLGVDIYLLNTEMTEKQFSGFLTRYSPDILIYDTDKEKLVTTFSKTTSIPAYTTQGISVQQYSESHLTNFRTRKTSGGKITVFTGGTSGKPKAAERKTSVSNFFMPFHTLLSELKLYQYNSVYITTPVYHGFGVAALCLSVSLGSSIYLTSKFETEKCTKLISKQQIEVLTTVPAILNRILPDAENLQSLRCIISGGSSLPPHTITEVRESLKNALLFNAYGTSETGFCVLATPNDLDYSPQTIGKPIQGTKLFILDKSGKIVPDYQIGQIFVSCKWSVTDSVATETGDLGYKDKAGYIYLTGRVDDMIISGGINVYPVELESILSLHPAIQDVAVIGIKDTEFGQRLWAFIVVKNDMILNEHDIFEWLKNKSTRYQTPKKISFINQIPLTSIGKPNKIELVKNFTS